MSFLLSAAPKRTFLLLLQGLPQIPLLEFVAAEHFVLRPHEFLLQGAVQFAAVAAELAAIV